LREELKAKIDKFEAREKEFFDQVKELDGKNDDKTKDVLSKLKEIETKAKEAFEIKDTITKSKARETELKLKLALHSRQFGEFENTLKTTSVMLKRFKDELTKVFLS
jgi:chromosome segregation ATPase